MNIDRRSISTLSAEAEAAEMEFDPKERSSFIRIHVKQIKGMIESKRSIEEIKAVFPEFSEQYPNLLEMLTRPGGFDERSLSLMINMLDQMGTGKTSQHQASIKVGHHLVNSYVKPQID